MMKKAKILMMLMAMTMTSVALAACGGDDDVATPTTGGGSNTTVPLTLTSTSVQFGQQGGATSVNASASAVVSAQSNQTWCEVSVNKMNETTTQVVITVPAMGDTDYDDRQATVTVTAGSEQKTIGVTQTAGNHLILSQSHYDVGAEGSTLTIALKTNGSGYTVTTDKSWVTEATGRGLTEYTHTFSVAQNRGAERTATITFALGNVTERVTVTQASGSEPGNITATAQDVAKLMYPGWNLGNTMEPPSNSVSAETSWQSTKTTQAIIDYVQSLGFKSVRIPCSWHCHMTNGKIDDAWMARVKEVVDYCINDGLYVLLNDHWDDGWLENSFGDLSDATIRKNSATLETMWAQIAETFMDYDDHLVFGGLNEPACDNQAKTNALLKYEQVFIDAVRSAGGNNDKRTLVVQGPLTDIDKTNDYFDVTRLSDPAGEGRLMVEVHYYAPWNFCGMEKDESWGSMFWYWGSANHNGGTRDANWGEEDFLKGQFQKMKTKFVDKGYPVVIGEYGCQWRSLGGSENQTRHNASVKLFHRLVNETAGNMGMVPMVWDINYTNQSGTKGVMTVIDRSKRSVFCPHAMDGITEGVAAATWPY